MATILRRISVVLTYYILYPLRVNPNAVSLFSILLVFLASYLFINSYFFYGAILIIMWVLLDAIDGELARIQKKISKIGGTLEKINSDILYILFLPSLSIGLYKIEIIPFDYVWTSIISIAIYNTLRVYISTFPKVKKKFIKNEFILFIACQFKNSFKLRKKKPLYSFIFFVLRNIFS